MAPAEAPSSHRRGSGAGRLYDEASDRVRPFFRDFGQLRIAVVAEPDQEGEFLVRELQRTRAQVSHIWPPPAQLSLTADVVYCELLADLPRRQSSLPGDPQFALVLLVPYSRPVDLPALHDCAPHGVLHHPITPQAVIASLVVARAQFLYERRLRGRIDKLDETLRTMRTVERAKSILIQSRSISEEEAYHYLRRQAMERRVSIGAIATAIVDSQNLLG